jgi:hypothetical protein
VALLGHAPGLHFVYGVRLAPRLRRQNAWAVAATVVAMGAAAAAAGAGAAALAWGACHLAWGAYLASRTSAHEPEAARRGAE